MTLLLIVLVIAALLCSLVAGFLFAFAVVVMPGIRRLADGEFIRAFQVMDGVIQRNQPLFMTVWLGSIVFVVAGAALAFGSLDAVERWLVGVATTTWLLGVQLPTVAVNVPLNNRLQAVDVSVADEPGRRAARDAFEASWNRWNRIRTLVACLSSLLLIVVLLRL